ncbi:MAG: tRNA-dihydrouridine synthase family protein [Holophagales bacterium]|jgi:tRNA-dihydrouridine synthase|nr:tRNA-dihydrouridine synthase family protein [Holophagales bacterium]
MFDAIQIGDAIIRPALFLAPMAGITNSAFRRLVADFGGYGALYTEMLSGAAFLREDALQSPFTKRRAEEGCVIGQFYLSGREDVDGIFAKAQDMGYWAIDINLGCPAPEIQRMGCGAALFRDFERLKSLLAKIRRVYHGPLTAKCRLGDIEDWRWPFKERLSLLEDNGICALTVHPRLSTEKLKRRARWEEFPWIASMAKMPIIGNGDIFSPSDVDARPEHFGPLSGLMLGRVAAIKPWAFREFSGMEPMRIDHAEVWARHYEYTLEDLPPERAIGRIKEFTHYFASNFVFGHMLRKAALKAKTLQEIKDNALKFLSNGPALRPNVAPPI